MESPVLAAADFSERLLLDESLPAKVLVMLSDLPRLVAALQDAGYRGEDLEKLLYRNWLRVFRASWHE